MKPTELLAELEVCLLNKSIKPKQLSELVHKVRTRSKSLKKQNQINADAKLSKVEKATKYREMLYKNRTEAELKFSEMLKMRNIEFEEQKIVWFAQSFNIADFLVGKLDIEIDGGYHFKGKQITRDKWRTNKFERNGYKTIRFTNEEVMNEDEKVMDFLNELTTDKVLSMAWMNS